MIIHHVPQILQAAFAQYTWHKNRDSNEIYLTFDDGPVVGITDKVLTILEKFDVKATFFMVGDNVRKNPNLALQVQAAGHQIGNHTYYHIRGNKSTTEKYLEDFQRCQDVLQEVLGMDAKIFRPPYGRITFEQARFIRKTHELIMWDVLSGDYDRRIPAAKCLKKSIKHTRNGSIIVFHDQEKTVERLPILLTEFLHHAFDKGFLPVVL